MQRRLLLVDDEAYLLNSLVRVFRHDGYEITLADSGEAALKILKECEFGVIVSDQRMPSMSGTELLSKVKELYPHTMRIVLSGFADYKLVAEAINKGAITKFFSKPWDDDQLRQNIREVFEQYELAYENQRLAGELKNTNKKLSAANLELEKYIASQKKYVEMNLKALRTSLQVIESFPFSVLVLDEKGVIVIANYSAYQLITSSNLLVGALAADALPIEINSILEVDRQKTKHVEKIITLNQCAYRIFVCNYSGDEQAGGTILAIVSL